MRPPRMSRRSIQAGRDRDAEIACLWGICNSAPVDDRPAARSVSRFILRDGMHRRFWLLLERPRAEVCAKPPGFDHDLLVETTHQWLTRWYGGETPGHADARR